MTHLKKESTGLSVNICIDANMAYIIGQHAKQIKFQLDYNSNFNSDNLGVMLLDGTVIQDTMKNSEIKTRDINEVRNFVLNNRKALESLADEEIDVVQFGRIMIYGTKASTRDKIREQEKLVESLKI